MPDITSIPPECLKRILVLYGYKVSDEDEFNWILTREGSAPIPVPKLGELVGADVLMSILSKAKMDNRVFLSLLAIYENEALKKQNSPLHGFRLYTCPINTHLEHYTIPLRYLPFPVPSSQESDFKVAHYSPRFQAVCSGSFWN